MSVLKAAGVNGQVSFDGRTVLITREGFLARVTHGRSEKAIPVGAIGALQFTPPSLLVNGFIQFSISGETSKKSIGGSKHQEAAKDENAVIFTKKSYLDFAAVRDAVREAQQRGPEVYTSVTDQLEKLANLRDRGALTPEEFAKKKSELLGRI
ncbi:DUF4429 domain-containing protein [Microbacterium sp. 77mftsu3.1]|uniref:DUF4429 domain-containing protein n=1 Tax=Microbacterium sp. 77mftsu3.1 TaxID=1761802 RepID=UPI000890C31F|nr:DUF4429 domain-containing protein [Microbacterium sp. 77mftsu3.1]SDH37226.1 protein of unknown function [Microbacterium sp. 77mftsu3.1]